MSALPGMPAPVSLEHAKGEPCPVVELARETFGDRGWDILVSRTCFPFSDDEAMRQLRSIIALKHLGGWPLLGAYFDAQDDEMERAMREASTKGEQ